MDKEGIADADLENSPTKLLFETYVAINQAAEKDENLFNLAREESRKLEEGEPESVAVWQKVES